MAKPANPPGGGKALAGFLLSGFELALLGAILPAWGYHRDPPQFTAVGNYFLSLALGIVFAAVVSRRIMAQRGLTFLLVFACALSCVSLAFLGMVSPPASEWWRVLGLFALGAGAGLLNMALFQAISGRYQTDAAGTVGRGGIWYGLGCLAATLLVAGTFSPYTIPGFLGLMAEPPAIFAYIYAKSSYTAGPASAHPGLRRCLGDFQSPGAVLFAMLLFIQFGN